MAQALQKWKKQLTAPSAIRSLGRKCMLFIFTQVFLLWFISLSQTLTQFTVVLVTALNIVFLVSAQYAAALLGVAGKIPNRLIRNLTRSAIVFLAFLIFCIGTTLVAVLFGH